MRPEATKSRAIFSFSLEQEPSDKNQDKKTGQRPHREGPGA